LVLDYGNGCPGYYGNKIKSKEIPGMHGILEAISAFSAKLQI
jgi:hypothetical protein